MLAGVTSSCAGDTLATLLVTPGAEMQPTRRGVNAAASAKAKTFRLQSVAWFRRCNPRKDFIRIKHGSVISVRPTGASL
jgi:hypothetical protein